MTKGVELSQLSNGITVATHRMPHLESVAMGLWIGAGTRSEGAGEHGISHLLEHMLFKGTRRRNAREIAEAIEAVGGEMNAETAVDHTTYYVRVLKDDIALGLDVLGDIVAEPLLDAEELGREKHVIIQEIGAARDVPEDWVFELFQDAAFPDQPLGRSILGTPASISALRPQDLRQFLSAHYTGPQMVLAAAGNLDHGEVVRMAERHIGSLPYHRAAPAASGLYRGGRRLEDRVLQEAQILIGFAAPSHADADFVATNILSAILGGGMASRLFQEIREKHGLCYSIYSFYWPFADTGLFGIHAATSEEDVETLVPMVAFELEKLAGGVTDAELTRAKALMKSGLLMTLESPIARASQMARQILMHGRPLALEEMVANVERVTSRDIGRLASTIIGGPPTMAAVGPVNAIPDLFGKAAPAAPADRLEAATV